MAKARSRKRKPVARKPVRGISRFERVRRAVIAWSHGLPISVDDDSTEYEGLFLSIDTDVAFRGLRLWLLSRSLDGLALELDRGFRDLDKLGHEISQLAAEDKRHTMQPLTSGDGAVFAEVRKINGSIRCARMCAEEFVNRLCEVESLVTPDEALFAKPWQNPYWDPEAHPKGPDNIEPSWVAGVFQLTDLHNEGHGLGVQATELWSPRMALTEIRTKMGSKMSLRKFKKHYLPRLRKINRKMYEIRLDGLPPQLQAEFFAP